MNNKDFKKRLEKLKSNLRKDYKNHRRLNKFFIRIDELIKELEEEKGEHQ